MTKMGETTVAFSSVIFFLFSSYRTEDMDNL